MHSSREIVCHARTTCVKIAVMRQAMAVLVLTLCLLSGGPAHAQDKPPGNAMIIAMAQKFVLAKIPREEYKYFKANFGMVQIHPQPSGNYWGVVGGVKVRLYGTRYRSIIYVVALRLICAQHDKSSCWRLEKLALDRNIIFDRGEKS